MAIEAKDCLSGNIRAKKIHILQAMGLFRPISHGSHVIQSIQARGEPIDAVPESLIFATNPRLVMAHPGYIMPNQANICEH